MEKVLLSLLFTLLIALPFFGFAQFGNVVVDTDDRNIIHSYIESKSIDSYELNQFIYPVWMLAIVFFMYFSVSKVYKKKYALVYFSIVFVCLVYIVLLRPIIDASTEIIIGAWMNALSWCLELPWCYVWNSHIFNSIPVLYRVVLAPIILCIVIYILLLLLLKYCKEYIFFKSKSRAYLDTAFWVKENEVNQKIIKRWWRKKILLKLHFWGSLVMVLYLFCLLFTYSTEHLSVVSSLAEFGWIFVILVMLLFVMLPLIWTLKALLFIYEVVNGNLRVPTLNADQWYVNLYTYLFYGWIILTGVLLVRWDMYALLELLVIFGPIDAIIIYSYLVRSEELSLE